MVLSAAFLLAACGPATEASKTSAPPSATSSSTASPAVVMAHFVAPDPSAAKIAANQSGADVFSDFIGFHEVGLRAGQSVTYQAVGNGTANYACNRTDGTLGSSQGSQQTASDHVKVDQVFVADANGEVSGVIIVPPPAAGNRSCPSGYAIGIWRSSYANMTVTDQENNLTWSAPDSGTQAQ